MALDLKTVPENKELIKQNIESEDVEMEEECQEDICKVMHHFYSAW